MTAVEMRIVLQKKAIKGIQVFNSERKNSAKKRVRISWEKEGACALGQHLILTLQTSIDISSQVE